MAALRLRARRWRWVLAVVLAVGIGLVALPVVRFEQPLSSVVFARDGRLLAATIAADGQWRMPEGEVPDFFARALLHYEDRRFAYHPGIDPVAVVRAAWANLRAGGVVSGASTLSMQLVRLARRQPRTWPQKLVGRCWRYHLLSFGALERAPAHSGPAAVRLSESSEDALIERQHRRLGGKLAQAVERGQVNGVEASQPRAGCDAACVLTDLARYLYHVDVGPERAQLPLEGRDARLDLGMVQDQAQQSPVGLDLKKTRREDALSRAELGADLITPLFAEERTQESRSLEEDDAHAHSPSSRSWSRTSWDE